MGPTINQAYYSVSLLHTKVSVEIFCCKASREYQFHKMSHLKFVVLKFTLNNKRFFKFFFPLQALIFSPTFQEMNKITPVETPLKGKKETAT